jgi:hypothetical protein
MAVETITVDGRVLSDAEIDALLAEFEEPLTTEELQALLDESNREASNSLLELLAALVVLALIDAIPRNRLTYNIREQRYYQGRSPILPQDIRRRINAEQQRNGMRMRRRAETMIDEQISFEEWQRQSITDLKRSHFRMAQAGAGTAGNLNRQHIDTLWRSLREEARRFRDLAGQIINGELSVDMILHRAQRYGHSTRSSYEEAQHVTHSDGRWLARRLLDPSAEHCPQCPGYAQSNWVPAGQIVPVGTACDCRANCRCRVEYRPVTLSDRLP